MKHPDVAGPPMTGNEFVETLTRLCVDGKTDGLSAEQLVNLLEDQFEVISSD